MDDRVKIIVDIDALVKLRFDYISTEIELSVADKANLEPKLREYFKEYVPQDNFTAYVMEVDGEVVSTAFLIIDKRPLELNYPNGRYGTIMNMFTYPEHRGKGYATSVMNYLIVDADAIFISVLDLYSTKAGKRLYEKLDFKEMEYLAMRYCTNK